VSDFEDFANEVVGPIRALTSRKRAIREELLSHLHEAAERADMESVGRDEIAAHILRRFGDVETVRREIEATIPWLERTLFVRFADRRDREGDFQYAARMSGYASALVAAFVLLSIGIHWSKGGIVVDEMLGLSAGPVVAFVILFGTFVLDMRLRRHVQRGDWRAAIVETVLEGALLGLVPVAACVAAEAVAPGIPHNVPIGAGIGLALFVLFVPAALYSAYWATREKPWIEDLGRDI
jgi:hypothetical protein